MTRLEAFIEAFDSVDWDAVMDHMRRNGWKWGTESGRTVYPTRKDFYLQALGLLKSSVASRAECSCGGVHVLVSNNVVTVRFVGKGKRKPVRVSAPVWESMKQYCPAYTRGMYEKSGKLESVRELLSKGLPNREIARLTGCSKSTVAKLKKLEQINAPCPCGLDAGHAGWCSFRFARSPKRQALLAKMRRATSADAPKPR